MKGGSIMLIIIFSLVSLIAVVLGATFYVRREINKPKSEASPRSYPLITEKEDTEKPEEPKKEVPVSDSTDSPMIENELQATTVESPEQDFQELDSSASSL